ncbi:hypothetical protein OIU84_029552 [Salix udensis]|uniref:Uncharacterized protein n=1 Tax=Salix udensis TaxID=889485 RepID=A0AAD6K9J1_9ROSI|nr:hypothetical protein OIU84_029552 [Salix udensis]
MAESFPMTGGDGPCSYTKNSSQQRASAASAKSLLTSAILGNLDIERSSRIRVEKTDREKWLLWDCEIGNSASDVCSITFS